MSSIKRNAFTMIELVWVIVIIGILSAIAIPKLAATRDDAQITKGRSEVASIRSAIMNERNARLLQGSGGAFLNRLDNGVANNTDGVKLFDSNETIIAGSPTLLAYPIVTEDRDGHWIKTGNNTYAYRILGAQVVFTYYPVDTTVSGVFFRAGTFDCNHANTNCQALTE